MRKAKPKRIRLVFKVLQYIKNEAHTQNRVVGVSSDMDGALLSDQGRGYYFQGTRQFAFHIGKPVGGNIICNQD